MARNISDTAITVKRCLGDCRRVESVKQPRYHAARNTTVFTAVRVTRATLAGFVSNCRLCQLNLCPRGIAPSHAAFDETNWINRSNRLVVHVRIYVRTAIKSDEIALDISSNCRVVVAGDVLLRATAATEASGARASATICSFSSRLRKCLGTTRRPNVSARTVTVDVSIYILSGHVHSCPLRHAHHPHVTVACTCGHRPTLTLERWPSSGRHPSSCNTLRTPVYPASPTTSSRT